MKRISIPVWVLVLLLVLIPLAVWANTAYHNLIITNSIINSTTMGATSPSSGAFTTLSSSGAVTLGGKLTENAGVLNTGVGLKHVRGGTCTTSAGSLGFCGGTIPWPSPFADTNYSVVCSLDGASAISLQGTTAKTTTTVSYAVYNVNGNTTAASGTLNCVGMHD
jgi:hypothetical protein